MRQHLLNHSDLKRLAEQLLWDFSCSIDHDFNRYTIDHFMPYFSSRYHVSGDETTTCVMHVIGEEWPIYTRDYLDKTQLLEILKVDEKFTYYRVVNAESIFFNHKPVNHKDNSLRWSGYKRWSRAQWRNYWRTYYKIPGTRQMLVQEAAFDEVISWAGQESLQVRKRTRMKRLTQDIDPFDVVPRGRRARRSWKQDKKAKRQYQARKREISV